MLKIAWLYYDILNIYGDRGNILAFSYRCRQRNLKVKIERVSLGQELKANYFDFIFAGGGQDQQQVEAGKDLQNKKKILLDYAEKNTPMLLICGSYQLFGHYFLIADGKKITGISLFDTYTIASKKRQIGNVVVKINPDFAHLNSSTLNVSNSKFLVGFENHSGRTYINSQFPKTKSKTQNSNFTIPLGKVIMGSGNNGKDKTEGAVYRNCVGTYLHGSLLPKNPHLCDWFIKKALARQMARQKSKGFYLKKLNDGLEWQTHNFCKKLKY